MECIFYLLNLDLNCKRYLSLNFGTVLQLFETWKEIQGPDCDFREDLDLEFQIHSAHRVPGSLTCGSGTTLALTQRGCSPRWHRGSMTGGPAPRARKSQKGKALPPLGFEPATARCRGWTQTAGK